jgi:hypothetical protein
MGRGQPFMAEFMAYMAHSLGISPPKVINRRVVLLQEVPERLHPRQEVPSEVAGQILNAVRAVKLRTHFLIFR